MLEEKNHREQAIDIEYNETGYSMEMEAHYHNSHEIIYVASGAAMFCINGKEYVVRENSVIFISNFESHNFKIVEYPYSRYFILIKPEYFYQDIDEPVLASLFKQRPENFNHVLKLHVADKEICNMVKDMYKEVKEGADFMQSALGSKLKILFIELYRNYRECFPLANHDSTNKVIFEIQKYIDNNLLEEITLRELSGKFYVDMYYLSHLFKKVIGLTFKEYLIIQRLSLAKDLLIETDCNITQVAHNSGFNNVNHFIRIFKKYEGITPYQYRKKLRADEMKLKEKSIKADEMKLKGKTFSRIF